MIGIDASKDSVFESRETGLPAANNGCGGRGRLGLPPYADDGVPGLGLPLICSGSYATLEAGGRGHELVVDPLEGVHGRVGEALPGDIGR